MKLIGIVGKARSGKDTIGQLIADSLRDEGLVVAKWAFADPLKTQVYGEFPDEVQFHELWGEKPETVRYLLQTRGTEQGRDVHGYDVWVREVEAQIKLLHDNVKVDVVILSDIRFHNEIEMILKDKIIGLPVKGRLISVESDRPGLTGYNARHVSENSVHPTFLARKKPLVVLNNQGTTKDELLRQVSPIIDWAKTK